MVFVCIFPIVSGYLYFYFFLLKYYFHMHKRKHIWSSTCTVIWTSVFKNKSLQMCSEISSVCDEGFSSNHNIFGPTCRAFFKHTRFKLYSNIISWRWHTRQERRHAGTKWRKICDDEQKLSHIDAYMSYAASTVANVKFNWSLDRPCSAATVYVICCCELWLRKKTHLVLFGMSKVLCFFKSWLIDYSIVKLTNLLP